MFKLVYQLNARVDNWFTAPEANAAGRLGLFRILFSLFYLWNLSSNFAARLGDLPPAFYYQRILLIEWLPKRLPPTVFELLESLLVAALIVLMVGFRVRLATAVVLMIGCVLEAFYMGIDAEHSTVFLVFYIPFFMLLNGRWGNTYSLDALLRYRRGKPRVDPANSSWHYFLPARCSLAVLSMLFLGSAVFKVVGTWLWYSQWMANHVLQMNIRAAIHRLPINPLAPFIAQTPLVHNALRYFTVLFEGLFFLGLFNRKLCYVFVALGLIFHSVSALYLVVTFTPILIVYALFVDWQALCERWLPKQTLLDTVPSRWLVGATLSLAVATGILWNSGEGLRTAINLGGLLNWRTIWYPVLPLSLAWCLVALVNLLTKGTNVTTLKQG